MTSKLQLNCSGLLSTRPDPSSPRTAFVAYPGSGSTYIRWTCDFPKFDRIRYSTYIGWACNKGLICYGSFSTTAQHRSGIRISRSSILLQTDVGTGLWQDHCDGGGWRWLVFSFFHPHQLCLQISVSSVLDFIPWLIFPFLEFPEGCFLSFTHHTALDSGNRDYTQQKAPISPYYRFSNLWVLSGNQNWTSSDFLTCSTIVDAAFFLSEIHSSQSFQCSGLEKFFSHNFVAMKQKWEEIWIAGTKSSATTRSRSSREKDTIHVPRKTQRWTQLDYSLSQSEIEEEKELRYESSNLILYKDLSSSIFQSLSGSEWVRDPWHLSRSPLCATYKGIDALYWPSNINYQLILPESVLYWPSTQLHHLVTHSWANWI